MLIFLGGLLFLSWTPGFQPVDWQDARYPRAFPNFKRALSIFLRRYGTILQQLSFKNRNLDYKMGEFQFQAP